MSTSIIDITRARMDSCSSDESFSGMEDLEPLNFDDIKRFRPKRYDSLDSDDSPLDLPEVSGAKFFTIAMSLKRKLSGMPPMEAKSKSHLTAKNNWKNAFRVALKHREDPWERFNLDDLPVEKAIRHRYNALTKKWKKDEALVKIDTESFNHGAMRECFRMKKLSNFCNGGQDWRSDCNNFVAKRYMDDSVTRDTYFEDVKLQNDAKLWGEEFNRHNPPKKVDIFQMAVIEMINRPGKPLYHIEHYIDGDYIKYNSNSGFVDSTTCRQTPHAFSHFTFERSGHDLIVVDIQGVGDLYTDPQIHTVKGDDYGDGNLGTKGMALFFHSHKCNSICQNMKLAPFDLSPKEIQDLSFTSPSSSVSGTFSKGKEIELSLTEILDGLTSKSNGHISEEDEDMEDDDSYDYILKDDLMKPEVRKAARKPRTRFISECSDDSANMNHELNRFQDESRRNAKPSCIMENGTFSPEEIKKNLNLGQIHLDLAKYHEICRFVPEDTYGEYDHATALFHLRCAADCGDLNAITSYYRLHFDLSHDILTNAWASDLDYQNEQETFNVGRLYAFKAVTLRDRNAMVFVAKAYDSGSYGFEQSTENAIHWYDEIIQMDEQDENEVDWSMIDPPYIILARCAELKVSGGEECPFYDPEKAREYYSSAAEVAMACMKGKLANKYFMLSEEI